MSCIFCDGNSCFEVRGKNGFPTENKVFALLKIKEKEMIFMKKQKVLLKMTVLSMFVAIGVVISPFLRVEGMCPMAHFINIVVSVFLGPWYSLLCAFLIGIIRMLTMAIPPLALTGAVFGAFLSGVFYRLSKGKILFAVVGEVIGTGFIGAICSYPVMTYIMGKEGLTWLFYVPSFVCGTLIGGSMAYVFLRRIADNGVLSKIQVLLASKCYTDKNSIFSNAVTIAAFGGVCFVVIGVVKDMFKLNYDVITYIAYALLAVFGVSSVLYYFIKSIGKAKEK